MPTDIRKIKKLIELLETSGIAEIEIKEGEDSVRISRHPHGAAPLTMPPIWAAPGYGPPHGRTDPAAPPAAPPAPEAEADQGAMCCARRWSAPSTARPRPAPSRSSKSASGQRRRPVCIIEAMKMFNQIEADHAGALPASWSRTASRSSSTNRC
jgi:acetyl-CoA carboxylase biotin carboxyl carrier protein